VANVFTDTTGATWDLLVETAFDRMVEYALRDTPLFRDVVDKEPAEQAMPGDVVQLTKHNDMPLAITPLSETVDPDAVGMVPPTRVPITLNEYGNTSLQTLRLRELSFTRPPIEVAILIGRNMADSIDRVVRNVLDTGTNLLTKEAGTLKTTANNVNLIAASDKVNGDVIATAVTLLRRRKAVPRSGENYVSVVHPDIAYDVMRDATGNTWANPHQYQDTENIYRGEIGTFLGAKFIQTTRGTVAANTVPVNVYTTYFLGAQALAEASAVEPHVVIGPQVDKLKRFFPVGWHALLGWAIYRQEALQVVKTSSTVQAL
jgi:N4-gp56 family major capsid protein